MLRAAKVRIYPTPEQAEYLNARFGAVRFAYNKALRIKKHADKRHGVSLNPRKDLKPLLAVAKKSRKYGWLKEFDSIALQQAVINLDVAFSNVFNPKLKTHFPTFKRKHGKQSSYHCVGIKVRDGAIKIPKLSPIEALIRREIKGSSNRRKARLQLAAVHERVANARADFQHKLSRTIVDENQAVIVETSKTANMMKNHNLARAAGFITKLEYKAWEKGVHLVKLDQGFASSKTCHCCGHKMPAMPLHKRIWQCPECGVEHDRDINAAINIERKGIMELCAAGLVVQSAMEASVNPSHRRLRPRKWEASPDRAGSSHMLNPQKSASCAAKTLMMLWRYR